MQLAPPVLCVGQLASDIVHFFALGYVKQEQLTAAVHPDAEPLNSFEDRCGSQQQVASTLPHARLLELTRQGMCALRQSLRRR